MYRQLKARPAWYGSVKVDADLPHDMASAAKASRRIMEITTLGQITISCEKSFCRLPDAEVVA